VAHTLSVFTVVVAAYNEARTVATVLRRSRDVALPLEINAKGDPP
jgi:hypothetical protein